MTFGFIIYKDWVLLRSEILRNVLDGGFCGIFTAFVLRIRHMIHAKG
jgi:hypothetical protein